MPLNKLDNFIKNTEGRILYVSPSDLDSTDSISNQGNSLTRPFKTIQRALIESARFSYIKGRSNDKVEKTTILCMPGEHIIDNRPGWNCYRSGDVAKVTPSSGGTEANANQKLSLTLNTIFDLTEEDNILYKFNSIHGGTIIPRGTSLVGLDLRKTKIRPKYVPNPTDPGVPNSAIFRITGGCYFWQFSIFDGDDGSEVYVSNTNFTGENQTVTPKFSHHKLTCFEYADGVNNVGNYGITDLDMYYAKLSNAYNSSSTREIEEFEKYPQDPLAFEKQRPEYEIVGAFATDPLKIASIEAGSGGVSTSEVTVKTLIPHKLQVGTPIKIRGVNLTPYNISAIVTSVNIDDDTKFTYSIPNVPADLQKGETSSATVTIETDTVFGSSPYIFNCSLRSVYGMNGLVADGSKSTGFRSMVVAQFTGISLQKDDRAFAKYDSQTRNYDTLTVRSTYGTGLPGGSSATTIGESYHLDSGAIYREGWQTTHIKMINDAVLQIVSVFAIGYTNHFEAQSGGDASITNSNSNFGQLSLVSEGFKKAAFTKDDKAFITSIIPPRSIEDIEENIDWVQLAGTSNIPSSTTTTNKLYLNGFNSQDVVPLGISQGYRIGAKVGDKLYVEFDGEIKEASILLDAHNTSSLKEYPVTVVPSSSSNSFVIGSNDFTTGEKVIIISDDADLPENLETDKIYYVITNTTNTKLNSTQIQLASSESNADNGDAITVSGGTKLKIITRVSDKQPGDKGHPVQWDPTVSTNYDGVAGTGNYYINVSSSGNTITPALTDVKSNVSYIKRTQDGRSLDEKIYKIRVVIPKETLNGKPPENGFIIQESSSTGYQLDTDATKTDNLTSTDYEFNRNPRFISTCSYSSSTITVISEIPHDLNIGDDIIVKNVTDSTNTTGEMNVGYNGTFTVNGITDDMTFTYGNVDLDGNAHSPGSVDTNDNTAIRSTSSPRFEKNDTKKNFYIYRKEVIKEYVPEISDGIYHLYTLSADNAAAPEQFTDLKYGQNVTNLYPQLDRDNIDSNPQSSKSFALRSPLGKVETSDLKKSLTRETIDIFSKSMGIGKLVAADASGENPTITFSRRHGLSKASTGEVTNAGISYGFGASWSGTVNNVKLLNGGQNLNDIGVSWKGATADVTVSTGNIVDNVKIVSSGSGYINGTALYFDETTLGPGNDTGRFEVETSDGAGTVLQFSGDGTVEDSYYRVTSVSNDTQVAIAKTAGDTNIVAGQYAIALGQVISGTKSDVNTSGLHRFTCGTDNPHGLVAGNKFQVNNTSDVNLGTFTVKTVQSPLIFDAETTLADGSFSVYILRHGYTDNKGVSNSGNENLGARSITIYDNEYAKTASALDLDDSSVRVILTGSISNILDRFPYGSYIEITSLNNSEIMRVASNTLSGASNDAITVIRGALGTRVSSHSAGSLIRKIKPLPIEFRRPSILRASGHTFEYLGYGPGNYSTALPQLQDRSLSEKEEYLAQSQEKSSGAVVYTGMNSKGDFYIGNTKKSALTGEETNFDVPIPTITGENVSKSSVVFDEVLVKERIVVEGSGTKQALSQFDGPVTFNNTVKVDDLRIGEQLILAREIPSENTTSGALVVKGGVGIGKSVFVGQGVHSSKLEVTKAGTQNIKIADGKAYFGDTVNGLSIDHAGDSGNASITNKTGWLNVLAGGNGFSVLNGDSTKNYIKADNDDAVTLYWAGTSPGMRLKTTSSGVEIGTIETDGELVAHGDITAFNGSDRRLKDNISPIKQALDKVNSISGNTFDWNEKSQYEGKGDTGVIAQEIEALDLPGVTTTRESGYKAVRYEKLVPLLIEAIKELSAKVDNLEQKLSDK